MHVCVRVRARPTCYILPVVVIGDSSTKSRRVDPIRSKLSTVQRDTCTSPLVRAVCTRLVAIVTIIGAFDGVGGVVKT